MDLRNHNNITSSRGGLGAKMMTQLKHRILDYGKCIMPTGETNNSDNKDFVTVKSFGGAKRRQKNFSKNLKKNIQTCNFNFFISNEIFVEKYYA